MKWGSNLIIRFGYTSMNKTKLRNAQYSINECLKQIKGYSFASRADMRHMLNRCVKDLHEQGFQLNHIQGLKPKHIHILVELWKKQGKNPATIKNYMSKLRKLSIVLNKPDLVKFGNDSYAITKRSYIPKHNKAIHTLDFSKCTDPMIHLSLEAQLLFGLRREESMKLVLSEAWQGDCLKIKPSWTKGGIGRTIEITSQEQRQWLMQNIQKVPEAQSLIPKERTYKQQLSHYQQQTKQMGISKCHGLRHAYAQNRYQVLTRQLDPQNKGLICPIQGGKTTKSLIGLERIIDRKARAIISRELGHSRLAISKVYLG